MTKALYTLSALAAAAFLSASGCSISDDAAVPASAPYQLDISGKVFDSNAKDPISGAVISLESYKRSDSNFTAKIGEISASSEDDGSFTISYYEKEPDVVYLIKAAGPASGAVKYRSYSTKLILYESSPSYDYLRNTYTMDGVVIGLTPEK